MIYLELQISGYMSDSLIIYSRVFGSPYGKIIGIKDL
jgi:hypothetical protein